LSWKKKQDAMMSEQNKAIAQKCFDAINRQDTTAIAEVMSPKWAAEITSWFPGINDRWPGHHIEVAEMVAEGDQVWCRLRTNAVSNGEWLGLPPNGKQWSNTGIWFLRIAEGHIIEIEWLFDEMDLVRQFGGIVVPAVNAEAKEARG
jgi:predicted ester cyclase